MNYYEELGLTPEATPDEIHRAHRKLTKLLHPDQQTDESLRRLAEAQMRRLNSIVDVLIDNDSRKLYDKGVHPPADRHYAVPNYTHAVNNMAMPAGMERRELRQVLYTAWKRLPWWVWSTAGALILTSAAVWFFADGLGSSFGGKTMAYVPVQDPPGQSASGASVSPPAATSTRESRAEARLQELTAKLRGVFETKSTEVPRAALGDSSSGRKPSRKELASSQSSGTSEQPAQPPPLTPPSPKSTNHSEPPHDPDAVLARIAPPKAESAVANGPPPPVVQTPNSLKSAPPAPAVGLQTSPSAASIPSNKVADESITVLPVKSGIEGEWIYAPKKPEKRKPGLYPPEFIELKLFRSDGALRGSYRARYQVDENRQISPEVSFRLMPAEEDTKMLSWEGDNGSRGWLKVNSVDKWTIKVQWQTTVYSKQPGLTAGVATLVRR